MHGPRRIDGPGRLFPFAPPLHLRSPEPPRPAPVPWSDGNSRRGAVPGDEARSHPDDRLRVPADHLLLLHRVSLTRSDPPSPHDDGAESESPLADARAPRDDSARSRHGVRRRRRNHRHRARQRLRRRVLRSETAPTLIRRSSVESLSAVYATAKPRGETTARSSPRTRHTSTAFSSAVRFALVEVGRSLSPSCAGRASTSPKR